MKILNLYAGIGGNRKLWGNEHEITAVEYNPRIAKVYKDYFPNDKVVVADAHVYLIDHYKEFDFVWSSPPCPTHSRLNATKNGLGQRMFYPDMRLYQEIIFLSHFFKGKFVVENVVSFYKPLRTPTKKIDRHYWWANFPLKSGVFERPFNMAEAKLKDYEKFLGYDLSGYQLDDKRKCLRNCVAPKVGLHVFNCAIGTANLNPSNQLFLF